AAPAPVEQPAAPVESQRKTVPPVEQPPVESKRKTAPPVESKRKTAPPVDARTPTPVILTPTPTPLPEPPAVAAAGGMPYPAPAVAALDDRTADLPSLLPPDEGEHDDEDDDANFTPSFSLVEALRSRASRP